MVSQNPGFFKQARTLNMKKYNGRDTTITTLVERELTKGRRALGGFREDLLYRVVPKEQAMKILTNGQDTPGNLHCITADQLDKRGLTNDEALAVFDPTQLQRVSPGEYQFKDSSRKLSALVT